MVSRRSGLVLESFSFSSIQHPHLASDQLGSGDRYSSVAASKGPETDINTVSGFRSPCECCILLYVGFMYSQFDIRLDDSLVFAMTSRLEVFDTRTRVDLHAAPSESPHQEPPSNFLNAYMPLPHDNTIQGLSTPYHH
jgi:hypothetical protein